MISRRAIAFLLVCLVMLPLIFNGALQVLQQCIKYGVEKRLATHELVTISIPLSQVQWMEEGREIMVAGKMFDIKQYEEKGGNLIAQGVYDEQETAVVNLMQHFSDEEQSNVVINLLALTQTFIITLLFYRSIPTLSNRLRHIAFYFFYRANPFLKVLPQPPQ